MDKKLTLFFFFEGFLIQKRFLMRLYYQKKNWKIKELELGLTVEGFSFFEFTNVCFFLGIYECMYKAFLHVMKHYKMSKNLSENVFGTFSPLYGIYDRIRLLEVD